MELEGNITTENDILTIRMNGWIWKKKQILRGGQTNVGYEAWSFSIIPSMSSSMQIPIRQALFIRERKQATYL